MRLGLGLGLQRRGGIRGTILEAYINARIAEGYIPVADGSDLNAVRTTYDTSTRVFAKGTKYETAEINTDGLADDYVAVRHIRLDVFNPAWHTNTDNEYSETVQYKRGDLVWTESGGNTSVWFYHKDTPDTDKTPFEGEYWRLVRTDPTATFAAGWVPISTFTGTFDGAGHIVYALFSGNKTATGTGLFGVVVSNNADIKNLFGANMLISGGHRAGFLGWVETGEVENVATTGTILVNPGVTNWRQGGICGQFGATSAAIMKNCYSTVRVFDALGTTDLGAVIGRNWGHVENIYADTQVSGRNAVGTQSGTGTNIGNKTTAQMLALADLPAATFVNIDNVHPYFILTGRLPHYDAAVFSDEGFADGRPTAQAHDGNIRVQFRDQYLANRHNKADLSEHLGYAAWAILTRPDDSKQYRYLGYVDKESAVDDVFTIDYLVATNGDDDGDWDIIVKARYNVNFNKEGWTLQDAGQSPPTVAAFTPEASTDFESYGYVQTAPSDITVNITYGELATSLDLVTGAGILPGDWLVDGTVLTIYDAFLSGLSVGTHVLTLVFNWGEIDINIEVSV